MDLRRWTLEATDMAGSQLGKIFYKYHYPFFSKNKTEGITRYMLIRR